MRVVLPGDADVAVYLDCPSAARTKTSAQSASVDAASNGTSGEPVSTAQTAYHTAPRAASMSRYSEAHLCLIARNEPIARPKANRVFA